MFRKLFCHFAACRAFCQLIMMSFDSVFDNIAVVSFQGEMREILSPLILHQSRNNASGTTNSQTILRLEVSD